MRSIPALCLCLAATIFAGATSAQDQMLMCKDEGQLAAELSSLQGSDRGTLEKRTWTLLCMARIRLYSGRNVEADVSFAAAERAAQAAGNRQLVVVAEQIRLDLLSSRALKAQDWADVAALVGKYGAFTWQERPPSIRAASRYALCLYRRDMACAAARHAELLGVLEPKPKQLWAEDFIAIRGLTDLIAKQPGMTSWAARFREWVGTHDAALTPEGAAEDLLIAAAYSLNSEGNDSTARDALDRVQAIAKDWKKLDDTDPDSPKNADDINKVHGTLLRNLAVLELWWRLVVDPSTLPVALDNLDKVASVWGDSDIGSSSAEFEQWLRMRATLHIGSFQDALAAAYDEQTSSDQVRNLTKRAFLIAGRDELPEAVAVAFAKTLIAVLPVSVAGVADRRQLSPMVCDAGLCDDAFAMLRPVMETGVELAAVGLGADQALAEDLYRSVSMSPMASERTLSDMESLLARASSKTSTLKIRLDPLLSVLRANKRPADMNLAERAERDVKAATTAWSDLDRSYLLWVLARGHLRGGQAPARLDRMLKRIEDYSAGVKDEEILRRVRLIRRLVQRDAGAPAPAGWKHADWVPYVGHGPAELVRAAVIASRTDHGSDAETFWSKNPLCAVRQTYRYAGFPAVRDVRLTSEESIVLRSEGSASPCGAMPEKPPLAVTMHFDAIAKASSAQTAGSIPSEALEAARTLAAMGEGPARSEAHGQLVAKMLATEYQKDRRRALVSHLRALDALRIPYGPEALAVADLLSKDNDDQITAAAIERLAIAHAAGIRIPTDSSGLAGALTTSLTGPGRKELVIQGAHYSFVGGNPATAPPRKESKARPASSNRQGIEKILSTVMVAGAQACSESQRDLVRSALPFLAGPSGYRAAVPAYRIAQGALYCGDHDVAVKAFEAALAVSKTGTKQFDAVVLNAYWAADLTIAGHKTEGRAAAAVAVTATNAIDEDDFDGLGARAAIRALLDAKLYDDARTLSSSLYRKTCSKDNDGSSCAELARMQILATTMAVPLAESLGSLEGWARGDDEQFRRESTKLSLDAFAALAGPDNATRQRLLGVARSGLSTVTETGRANSDFFVRLAEAGACAGDWRTTVDAAKSVSGGRLTPASLVELDWWSEAASAPDIYRQRSAVANAVRLSGVASTAMADVRGAEEWRAARLPNLLDLVRGSDAVPVSERAHALMLAGLPNEALALLRTGIQQFRAEIPRLNDQRLPKEIAIAVAGTSDIASIVQNEPILEAIVPSVDDDTAKTLRSVVIRLLARIAYEKHDYDKALQLMMTAGVSESESPLRRPEDRKLGPAQLSVVSNTVEDLADVARQRSRFGGARSAAAISRDLEAINARLKRDQRPRVAELLVNHGGSMIDDMDVRQDLGFKVMQASTVGATGVDLMNAIEAGRNSDPEIRAALATLQEAEGQLQQQLSESPKQPDKRGMAQAMECPDLRPAAGAPASPWAKVLSGVLPREQRTFPRIPRSTEPPTTDDLYDRQRDAMQKLNERANASRTRGGVTQPVGLKSLVARLSPAQAVMFLVSTDETTLATLITRQGILMREAMLDGKPLMEADVERLVREVRRRLELGPGRSAPPVEGDPLYRALFEPFSGQLEGVQEMSIVARGPLEALPFSVLAIRGGPTAGSTIWFDDRYVWQFAMAAAETSVPSQDRVINRVMQIGPPVFTGVAGRGCNAPLAPNDPANRQLSDRLCNIDALEYLSSGIRDKTGTGLTRKLLAGDRATKRAVLDFGKDITSGTADVLVLATHGLVPEETQLLTGTNEAAVVLPEGGLSDAAAVLTSSEISRLTINAREVVLVACNSAGAAAASDERAFSGLVRAFFHAGARRVVAAMASVPIDSTGPLMQDYFDDRVAGSASPRALSDARRKIRKSGMAPAHWGGMVSIGTY